MSRAGSAGSPRLAPGFLSPRQPGRHSRRPSSSGLASAAGDFRTSPRGPAPAADGLQSGPTGLKPAASGLSPAANGLGSSPGGSRLAASGLGPAVSGLGPSATGSSQLSNQIGTGQSSSLSRAGSGSSGLGPSRAFMGTIAGQRSSGSGQLSPMPLEPSNTPSSRTGSSNTSHVGNLPIYGTPHELLSSDASGDHVIVPSSFQPAGDILHSHATTSHLVGTPQQSSRSPSWDLMPNQAPVPPGLPLPPISGDGQSQHRWGDSLIDSGSLDAIAAPSSVNSLPSLVRTTSLDGPAFMTDDWTFAIQPPLGSPSQEKIPAVCWATCSSPVHQRSQQRLPSHWCIYPCCGNKCSCPYTPNISVEIAHSPWPSIFRVELAEPNSEPSCKCDWFQSTCTARHPHTLHLPQPPPPQLHSQ